MAEIRKVSRPEEVDELLVESVERPVWVFKHSLACGASARAFEEFLQFVDERPDDDSGVYTLVEIQNARQASNAVTERTAVRHESPQALLLRDGRVAWDASHWKIQARALEEAHAAGSGDQGHPD